MHPDRRAVAAHVALLERERRPGREHALGRGEIVGDVLGVGDVGHAQAQHLLERAAEDGAVALVGEQEAAVEPRRGDADRGLAEDRLELALAGRGQAPPAAELQGRGDVRQELKRLDRLDQIVVGAGAEPGEHRTRVGLARQQQHRGLAQTGCRAHGVQQGQRLAVARLDAHQHEARRLRAHCRERGLAVARHRHRVGVGERGIGRRVGRRRGVDDQDGGLGVAHRTGVRGGAGMGGTGADEIT